MAPVFNLSVKCEANIFISDRCSRILWRLPKAHHGPKLRVLASSGLIKKCDLGVWRRKQKRQKRNSNMWRVTYFPRPPALRYSHRNCHVGWVPDAVNHAKFHQYRFRDFGSL